MERRMCRISTVSRILWHKINEMEMKIAKFLLTGVISSCWDESVSSQYFNIIIYFYNIFYKSKVESTTSPSETELSSPCFSVSNLSPLSPPPPPRLLARGLYIKRNQGWNKRRRQRWTLNKSIHDTIEREEPSQDGEKTLNAFPSEYCRPNKQVSQTNQHRPNPFKTFITLC